MVSVLTYKAVDNIVVQVPLCQAKDCICCFFDKHTTLKQTRKDGRLLGMEIMLNMQRYNFVPTPTQDLDVHQLLSLSFLGI